MEDTKIKTMIDEFVGVQKYYVNTLREMQKDMKRLNIIPNQMFDRVY